MNVILNHEVVRALLEHGGDPRVKDFARLARD